MTKQLHPIIPSSRYSVILLALLAAAYALRLWSLTRQDIWWDEARNLDVALLPFGQVATTPELDIHPPLYFWLLHGWLRLGDVAYGDPPVQIAFMGRYLSVLAGVVSVALLAAWGRRLAASMMGQTATVPIALCAALVGALAPLWWVESQETRMYTLGFALVTAASLALWRATIGARQPGPAQFPVRLLPYIVLGAASLLVHYNVAFILAAWHGWWLLWAMRQPQRWTRVAESVGAGVATLLLVSPILPIALRQIPTYANPNLIVPSLWSYLWQNWRAYFGGYAVDSAQLGTWIDSWLAVVALLCAGGLAVVGARYRQQDGQRGATVIFLLCWLVGGLALYYVAVLDRGAFNVRYASFVTPALYVVAGLAMVEVTAARRIPLALVAGVVVVGLVAAVNAQRIDPDYFREDVSGLVSWLREHSTPEDVILVDQRYPFGFYWPGYADRPDETPLLPADLTVGAHGGAPARYLFVDINTLDARLNEAVAGGGRVFWVQWFESDTDPRRAVPFLLDQVGMREETRQFRGFTVQVWQVPAGVEFALAHEWQPLGVTFDGAVKAVEMSAPPDFAGTRIPVVIRWARAEVVEPVRWKARVALYDQTGARLAQSDPRLLNDRHLFPVEWQATDTPLNVYMLTLDAPPAPGIYELRLLVYDEDAPDHVAWVHATDVAPILDGVEVVLASIVSETK